MYFNWTEIFCYKIDFNYLFLSGEKSIKCRLICYRACFVKIYICWKLEWWGKCRIRISKRKTRNGVKIKAFSRNKISRNANNQPWIFSGQNQQQASRWMICRQYFFRTHHKVVIKVPRTFYIIFLDITAIKKKIGSLNDAISSHNDWIIHPNSS